MPNIELLNKVLKHIEDNPGTWDQRVWRCGTSYCFAGHAAVLSGWKPKGEETELYWRLNGFESEEKALEFYAEHVEREKSWFSDGDTSFWTNRLEKCTKLVPNTSDVVLKGDEQETIASVAIKELDLDEDTAGILFRADNSLNDLREMISEIKNKGRLEFDIWE